MKVRSLESLPFLSDFHFCNVLHVYILSVRVIPLIESTDSMIIVFCHPPA